MTWFGPRSGDCVCQPCTPPTCPAEICNSFGYGSTFLEESSVDYNEIRVVIAAGLPADLVYWRWNDGGSQAPVQYHKVTVFGFGAAVAGTWIFNRYKNDGSQDSCEVGRLDDGTIQDGDLVNTSLSYTREVYDDSGGYSGGIWVKGCPRDLIETHNGTTGVGIVYVGGEDLNYAFSPPATANQGSDWRMMVAARKWSSTSAPRIIQGDGSSLPGQTGGAGNVVKDIADDRAKTICDELTHTMRFNDADPDCGIPAAIYTAAITVTRLQT